LNDDQEVVFEVKEDDDAPRDAPSAKKVHFAGIDSKSASSSRSSQDFEVIPPASSSLLGTNAASQENREEISNFENPEEYDGVGVSMEDPRQVEGVRNNSMEDKAGIILGIHNIFIVIPQFLISGISSIIFAIMDPEKSGLHSPGHAVHPGGPPSIPTDTNSTAERGLPRASIMVPRFGGEDATKSVDSLAVIFLLGGFSAAVACILAVRLARELKRARR